MSRFTAIAAALALVVSGIMIGALSTYLALARPAWREPLRPRPGPQGPAGLPFTREMEDRLDLSDVQEKQLQAILRESRDASETIRRELRPRLEAQLEATRTRIAALLTPDQRTKFEELVKQDRRRAERFLLEGPPPPPGPGWPGPPPDGPPR
jgi:Spy/CpxP family protein refolding chaperone